MKTTAQPCKHTAKTCRDGTQNVPPHHSSLHCAKQADPHSQQLYQQQQSHDLAIAQPCKQSGSAAIIIKLCKADPEQQWHKLTSEAPVVVPVKQPPASPEAMAAMRRTLMQQRQQRAQAPTHHSSAISGLPASRSHASANQQASLDAKASISALPAALSSLPALHSDASANHQGSFTINADISALPAALSSLPALHSNASATQEVSSDVKLDVNCLPAPLSSLPALHSNASAKQEATSCAKADTSALPTAVSTASDIAELAAQMMVKPSGCQCSALAGLQHELAQINGRLLQPESLCTLLDLTSSILQTCMLPQPSHKQRLAQILLAFLQAFCHLLHLLPLS